MRMGRPQKKLSNWEWIIEQSKKGLTLVEIAQEMDINIRTLQYRAKKRFGRSLEHVVKYGVDYVDEKDLSKGEGENGDINWKSVELSLVCGSSIEDVAFSFDLTFDEFDELCREETGIDIERFADRCDKRGKNRLLQSQYKAAIEGSTTLLVWLGKQRLGQRDKNDIDLASRVPDVIEIRRIRDSDLKKDE